MSVKKNWPFFLYAILIFAGVFFHEIWRDEAQALLIAKTARGYWDLIAQGIRYEGQPFLWYALVRLVSPGEIAPLGMQLLNALIMIASAALFWWRFPLPTYLRGILLFNYFFLFEFGIVARPFGLGLLLFFFGICFMDDERRWMRNCAFAALLLLIQNTLFSGLLVSGVFVYRWLRDAPLHGKRVFTEVNLVVISVAIMALQVFTPADGVPFWKTDITILYVLEVLQRFGQAFLYFPNFGSYPALWENLADSLFSRLAKLTLLVFFMVGFSSALYRRDKRLLAGFYVSFLALFLFAVFKFLGNQRHTSHIVMLFAGFFWLGHRVQPFQLEKLHQTLFKMLGGLSVLSGLTLYGTDLIYPFSDAKNASVILQENRDFTVVWPDNAAPALSAYLNGRDLYYFEGMRRGSYIKWDNRGQQPPPELADFEVWLKDRGVRDFLFVTNNQHVAPFFSQRFLVDKLYRSSSCIVAEECYEVLRVNVRGMRRGAEPSTKPRGPRDVATDRPVDEEHRVDAIKSEKR